MSYNFDIDAKKTIESGYISNKLFDYYDTGARLTSGVCDDWFDGANSAMFKFARGEPVKPSKLLEELYACKKLNTSYEKEQAKIAGAIEWLEEQIELYKAFKALKVACATMKVAIDKTKIQDWSRVLESAVGELREYIPRKYG